MNTNEREPRVGKGPAVPAPAPAIVTLVTPFAFALDPFFSLLSFHLCFSEGVSVCARVGGVQEEGCVGRVDVRRREGGEGERRRRRGEKGRAEMKET